MRETTHTALVPFTVDQMFALVADFEHLRYEDFSSSDWALQGVDPATIPTVLTLGADPDDYSLYLARCRFVTHSVSSRRRRLKSRRLLKGRRPSPDPAQLVEFTWKPAGR